MPASELLPNTKNWRTHPEKQQAALRAVLDEIGYADALIARELPSGQLMLVDGHLRAETTPNETVPVLVLDVNEDEANKLLVSLDPLAAMAGANKENLDALLRSVQTGSQALATMLSDLGSSVGLFGVTEEDGEPPAPPENTTTKPGDLWLLGEHRLLCGDSNRDADIARVLDGAQPDVAVIDPPFEAKESQWTRHIMDPCIVFGIGKHIRAIPAELYRFERVIDKVTRRRCPGTYVALRHAFLAQCGTRRHCPKNRKASFDSIVTRDDKTRHGHQKPVAMLVEHLTHFTGPWRVLFDPYGGSGTSVMAAEQMGRSARVIEMDPAYCDVIRQRWEQATGREAILAAN